MHAFSRCPAREDICKSCYRKNRHWAKICRVQDFEKKKKSLIALDQKGHVQAIRICDIKGKCFFITH